MPSPTVSVIIPCYNAKTYIADAIESALAQTHAPFEVIVVDDGSNDGTEIYIEEAYSGRVVLLKQNNQGPSAARNAGVEIANGEWCAFLDADDTWVETKLEEQVKALQSQASAILVACEASEIISGGGSSVSSRLPRPFSRDALRKSLLRTNAILIPGALVKTSAFIELGGFNTTLRCGEDWEFTARVFRSGEIAAVHEPLVRIRVVPESASQNPVRALQDTLKVHRMIWPLLAPPGATIFRRTMAVLRLDSKIYLSVAWIHSVRGEFGSGLWCWLQSMLRWPLWPISSLPVRIGVFLLLLRCLLIPRRHEGTS